MATAPTPGVGERQEATAAAQTLLNLDYDGQVYRLGFRNVPISEQRACILQTDKPLVFWLTEVDGPGEALTDPVSLCVLVWMARRAGGERRLRYQEVESTFDVHLIRSISVDEPDAKDDDPEA